MPMTFSGESIHLRLGVTSQVCVIYLLEEGVYAYYNKNLLVTGFLTKALMAFSLYSVLGSCLKKEVL